MGAFFLAHKDSVISNGEVKELYLRKGFRAPHVVQAGDYNLLLYRKQLVEVENYYGEGDNYIFATGSLFYKGFGYTDSLKYLLRDFTSGGINANLLYGNYSMLFYNSGQGQITFCIDPSFIKSVYFDKDKRVISTDFLSVVESSPYKYSINTEAVAESMITGSLVSPDTYAVGIQKVDRKNIDKIATCFQGIRVMVLYPDIPGNISGRTKSLENANRLLTDYFEAAGNISMDYGASIGLTGGFDSRLLLMHARSRIPGLVTNSFWRPGPDYENARLLAEASGLEFTSFEDKPYETHPVDRMVEKAYLFFDGQVRSQNNWDEEFNMPDYCSGIGSGRLVGFHGSGGEQYRNAERMAGNTSLKSYILYDWMFRQCSDVVIGKELRESVYRNIRRKIVRLTGIGSGKIGLKEHKIIQNEVWNTSNRSMRVNTLNQQQFYFAPFTEYLISRTAYLYVPYLGNSFRFQIDMMRLADPDLAAIKNNYGFNFLERLPLKELLTPIVLRMLPRWIFYRLYFFARKMQSNQFKYDLRELISVPVLSELSKDIDMEMLSRNKNLGNSIISFSYLLKSLKINWVKEKQKE